MFGKKSKDPGKLPTQPAGLISVLLDRTAEFGDRDDAAMDLGEFEGSEVVAALERVANDPGSESGLVDSCKESLAEIRLRSAGTE